MKPFDIFDRPDGWASPAAAFEAAFRDGTRIQAAPWGGLAILGHAELTALARHPAADGMPPDPAMMPVSPDLLRLIQRALFTGRGALIAAFDAVPLTKIVDAAIRRVEPDGPAEIDLRAGLVAPVMRHVWGAITGHDEAAMLRLSDAVQSMSYVLSVRADPEKAHLADAGAREALSLACSALEGEAPFARLLRDAVGPGRAAELLAGMAMDAVETAGTGVDAALRIAFARRGEWQTGMAAAAECLRLASSTPMTMRQATADIILGDLHIPAGAALSMIWPAGNHDPAAFSRPERIDPGRKARPVMFGMGTHACLGHTIIRTTLTGLMALMERRGMRLTGDLGRWAPLSPGYLPPVQAVF